MGTAFNNIIPMILKENPETTAIYLYGSTSSGTANSQSDVDLAVLTSQKIPDEKRFELAQKLAGFLKKMWIW